MFLDLEGGKILESELLGYGGTGVVILRDGMAIKMPLRRSRSSEADVREKLKVIRIEQDVYRRLSPSQTEQCPGVVPCLGFTEDTIQLAYMQNGELRAYLESPTASRAQQLSWFRQMARALAHIHDRRVLVTDIATRNFLLDTDLSVMFCDFNNASLLPVQMDMETVDDDGYTVAVDIGMLGAVMYEIVTGSKCEIDLYKDNDPTDGRAYWPRRADLPSTENLWLGSIIEDCWTGGYRDANSLWQALEAVDQQHSLTKGQFSDSVARSIWSCIQEPSFTLTAICGLALCVWMKQRGVNR